jgi:hypothetical protein
MHRHEPNAACPVGANLQAALAGVFAEAEAALVRSLESKTLGDILRTIQDCVGPCKIERI